MIFLDRISGTRVRGVTQGGRKGNVAARRGGIDHYPPHSPWESWEPELNRHQSHRLRGRGLGPHLSSSPQLWHQLPKLVAFPKPQPRGHLDQST